MQKGALYGIIAAAIVAAGIGIAFAAMSMNNSAEPAVASPQSGDNQVRVIKHAAGETEITGTPERVVVFSNNDYVEDVLALGVQPIGVAEPAKMREQLVDLPISLSPDVADVGTDDEPNLEVVAQLEPDLIIGRLDVNGQIYDDLSRIAPTVLFQHVSVEEGTSRLEVQRQNFLTLADALNRQDKGAEVLEMQQARYDVLAAEIEAAGLDGTKFILVETFSNNPDMFQVYDSNFPAVEILESVGLESAVTSEDGALFNQDFIDQTSFSPWGISNVGLEAITTFDGSEVHFIHGARHGQRGADVMGSYDSNPVWQDLEFVKAGNVHDIGNVWMTGGIYTTTAVVEKVVDALTGASGTRTISHALGETEITGTPERIVVLDTYLVEPLLAFDIKPVGMAYVDIVAAQYPQTKQWVDVADVGSDSGRPNLEVIASLEPDLILGPFWAQEIYGDLSDIAPTILTDIFPEDAVHFEQSKMNFMTVADALGRHEEGAAYIENMEAEMSAIKAEVEAAGLAGTRFVFVEFHPLEDSPSLFVFHKTAFVSNVLEGIGLVNMASPPAEHAKWGILDVGLEGLSTLDGPDVHLFYYRNVSWEDASSLSDPDGIPDSFDSNPVWNDLSFVKEGRVHHLDIPYVYGGPLTAVDIANSAADALTG